MALKVITNCLAVFILFLIQVSFFSILVYPLNYINIVVPATLFATLLLNRTWGIYWTLLFAVFMEFYSPYYPGLFSLNLLFTLLAIDFMAKNFFTNRSVQGIITLLFLGGILFQLGIRSAGYILYIVKLQDHPTHLLGIYGGGVQIFFNIIAGLIMLLLWNKIIRRIRLFFIYS